MIKKKFIIEDAFWAEPIKGVERQRWLIWASCWEGLPDECAGCSVTLPTVRWPGVDQDGLVVYSTINSSVF